MRVSGRGEDVVGRGRRRAPGLRGARHRAPRLALRAGRERSQQLMPRGLNVKFSCKITARFHIKRVAPYSSTPPRNGVKKTDSIPYFRAIDARLRS